jgi:hypothetical protein
MAKPALPKAQAAGVLRKPWEAEPPAKSDATRLQIGIDQWVGTKLMLRRQECGITRLGLAVRMGTHESSIRRWEGGVTSLQSHIIWQLAKVLEVDPAFFFEGFSDTDQQTVASQISNVISPASLRALTELNALDAGNKGLVMQLISALSGRVKADGEP